MSESDLDRILNALPLAALVIGRDARISQANGRAETLLGAHLVGRHYLSVLRQPAIQTAIEACLSDGIGRDVEMATDATAMNSLHAVKLTRLSLSTGDGVLVTFQDMTAIQRADALRRDFVANVSHELRTPLTALVGFIETLRGPARDDPAARAQFLEIMAQEAARMERLVRDLLSLSRVQQYEAQRPRGSVDLTAICRAACAAMHPIAEAAGVTLEMQLPEVSVTIAGDADQVSQLLANLLENAVKYGADGGVVRLELCTVAQLARLRGPAAILRVTDKGRGIDARHLPRLTERFYRVDTHRARAQGGTGLGLAIVKHIVNRHRGHLSVQSEPGSGSTFSVFLPLENAPPSAQDPLS